MNYKTPDKMMEPTEWDWQQAKGVLTHMGMCYSGMYIVSSNPKEKYIWLTVILPLDKRFREGERTVELYREIMKLED